MGPPVSWFLPRLADKPRVDPVYRWQDAANCHRLSHERGKGRTVGVPGTRSASGTVSNETTLEAITYPVLLNSP